MVAARKKFLFALSFTLVASLGMFFSVLLFSERSEPGNQVLFGLSVLRLLIGSVFLLLVAGSMVLGISLWRKKGALWEWFEALLASNSRSFAVSTLLYGVMLLSGGLLLLNHVRVVEGFETLIGISSRLEYLLAWAGSSALVLLTLLFIIHDSSSPIFLPLRRVLWLWMALLVYIPLVMYYREAAYLFYLKRFEVPLLWWGGFLTVWALASTYLPKDIYKPGLERLFLLLGIFLTVWVAYVHLATWLNWIHKGPYEYWNILAGQFLQGKLYMPDPVGLRLPHDQTFYQGKWYIPNPPFPAILVMPLAAFMPASEIHMGDISMIFSALNALLVFLILEQMRQRGWVRISQAASLWLVALFSFGTNHLWVGINGGVWFISQVLTVTWLALAVYAASRDWHPWLAGLGIALAIGSRPNSLMTWPFVFAIAMQIAREKRDLDWKHLFRWSFQSALPIGLSVAGLLLYNHARFDDFLDFGYTTINGADEIVKNAQTYGLFSSHYLAYNFKIMFLNMPVFKTEGPWFIWPDRMGISIFVSTPLFFYLFRRYENQWWVWGAWAAIVLNLGMLLLYHNTGSAQFGYRYILDAIIPLLALLALAFQKKLPWHFYILLFYSVAINIYGAAWFIFAE